MELPQSPTLMALVVAVLVAGCAPAAASSVWKTPQHGGGGKCVGLNSTLGSACFKLTSERACLKTSGYKFNYTLPFSQGFMEETCRWRREEGNRVHYTSYASATALQYFDDYTLNELKESECTVELTVSLPPSAKGRWSVLYDFSNGGIFQQCHLGSYGTRNACTMRVTPSDYFQPGKPYPNYATAGLYFGLSDNKLIKKWNKTKSTGKLTVRMDRTVTLCKPNPEPVKRVPIGRQSLVYGPTTFDYKFYPGNGSAGYTVHEYNGYPFTGPNYNNYPVPTDTYEWEARVAKSLERTGRKTKLTVFLADETAFLDFRSNCEGVCKAPVATGVKGTFCRGFVCRGRIAGKSLNATATYRLYIGYPGGRSPYKTSSYSQWQPFTIPYAKQVVEVEFFRVVGKASLSSRSSSVTSRSAGVGQPSATPA